MDQVDQLFVGFRDSGIFEFLEDPFDVNPPVTSAISC